jgi:ketosteroid isomerase-like protein
LRTADPGNAVCVNREEDVMASENVDLVRSGYEAFNRGDIDAVLALLDDDVQWHEPGGGGAPSGTFRGPQSIASDLFSHVPEQFEEFSVETERFIDAGEQIVVIGRFRGRAKSGKELDAAFAHVATVRDGKEVEFRNYVAADEWADAWS